MTTIDVHPVADTGSDTGPGTQALATVSEWFVTTDHKRIGRMYMSVALLMALGTAALGALLNFDAASSFIDKGALAQLSSAYRIGLTFMVVVPLMLGIATAVVPLQLGARSIAFPRLAAAGFWMWLLGSILVIVSLVNNGGPGGGDIQMVAMFMTAHMLLLLGLVAGAVSLATSIMTTRAAGMNMRRVPPFSWSVMVFAICLIISLPVLMGTLLLNYLNFRYGGVGFGTNFDIVRWIGFGFTQPMTFVYAIPVFGFAAEVIATATKQRLAMRGLIFAGISLVGVAALAGVTQNQALLRDGFVDSTTSQKIADAVPYVLFNLLPLLGGFMVLALAGSTLRHKPTISAPLLFGFFGAGMVFVGMLANTIARIADTNLVGTRFEEGVWIYVMYGALLTGLGAVSYWSPKLWGPVLATKHVAPLVLLGLGATVLSSLPLLVAGFADGIADAAATVAGVGHVLMLLTILAFGGLAAKTFRSGDHAVDDPWDGQTLEWAATSPAPLANFDYVRTIISAEPLLDLKPSTVGSDA